MTLMILEKPQAVTKDQSKNQKIDTVGMYVTFSVHPVHIAHAKNK